MGNFQASYTYDAWGKVLSVKDKNGNEITDPNHIANINPIRYRGYYYDRETGLYFLQTRYYDPETGRFINADDTGILLTDQGSLIENNLFTYCFNNPINMLDQDGEMAEQVLSNPYFWTMIAAALAPLGIYAIVALATIGSVIIFAYPIYQIYKSIKSITAQNPYKKAEKALPGIARKYGNLKCKEAAKAMQKELTKLKLPGAIVTITFSDKKRGWIWSESKKRTISENGIHVGVLFNGRIYCNVHPTGLAKNTWIKDFYGNGYKNVITMPF